MAAAGLAIKAGFRRTREEQECRSAAAALRRGSRDGGILTSLMVMEVILEKKQTLGKLADEVKIYPQLLKNVRVKDKKTARENPAVQAAVDKAAEELGTEGRILVRESGTEPVIRVMVEAASDDICAKYVDSVVKVIEAEGLTE